MDKWKHPEPLRPPTAPGGMFIAIFYLLNSVIGDVVSDRGMVLLGTKYERNLPAPILDREFDVFRSFSYASVVC